ncbi:MAG: Gfo/Idh/MocA family protein [Flexilinea sp.]
MNSFEPMRVAIIGNASRASYMYGPILQGLPEEVKLVAVWGRSEESAACLGRELGVPWYVDLERLVRETAPQIGIVAVNHLANGQVALMALEAGLHILVETPIADRLIEADKVIRTAEERRLKIEVSEQFHRRPLEQIKLRLIATGLFGRVYSSFNDFAGHGYHGVSVMRSYLGFAAKPIRVTGSVHEYELLAHWSRIANTRGTRIETQEHGMIEFDNGQLGIFHWSDVSYDSALRWWRSSRFLAEKGMGISICNGQGTQELLSLISPDCEAPHFITLERRFERVDGGMLEAMIAYTGDPNLPIVRWDNPLRSAMRPHRPQWHDDEIGVASCILSLVNAVRNNTAPSYGPLQGRLDQEIILAIRQSALEGGKQITLPIDPETKEL